MTTANVTMDTGLGLKHRGRAGHRLPAARHRGLPADREGDRGAARRHGRGHGHQDQDRTTTSSATAGSCCEDPDFDDLVVAINTVSSQLQGAGYGDRVLAAVFAFEENGKPLYFIYNFKRGAYYPFVPATGEQARDTERELRIQSQLGAELPWRRTWPAGSRYGTSRCRAPSAPGYTGKMGGSPTLRPLGGWDIVARGRFETRHDGHVWTVDLDYFDLGDKLHLFRDGVEGGTYRSLRRRFRWARTRRSTRPRACSGCDRSTSSPRWRDARAHARRRDGRGLAAPARARASRAQPF